MKGYRFITDDDTVDFCQRVTEALSNRSESEFSMIINKN